MLKGGVLCQHSTALLFEVSGFSIPSHVLEWHPRVPEFKAEFGN